MDTETKTEILEKLVPPAPTNHFHEPMKWTLADVQRLFPTGRFKTWAPVGRDKEIMRGI